MKSKLSRKKNTSEIVSRKYSRKNRKLKKEEISKFTDLIGGNIDTIDKDKLSYTYLLGLKFTQLNKKKFRRLLRIIFRFKLRSKKEELQMEVFRNGIKMMKYYQKLLKYVEIYEKIADKIEKSIMKINNEIDATISILNELLRKINILKGETENIINNNKLLEIKIEYEAQKRKLNRLIYFRTEDSLFKRKWFSSIRGYNIGYLIYLYRKAEAKFNHIFYKFNEKAVNFSNAMSKLKVYYGNKMKTINNKFITTENLRLRNLDIEHFYNGSITYEFLPNNQQLKTIYNLKNFDGEDKLVQAINDWIYHYQKIIVDLPTQLKLYQKINSVINSLGIINNPFSKPFFHRQIRKKKIEDETLEKNLRILIAELSHIYGVDSSLIHQSGGASIPISQAYSEMQSKSTETTQMRFLTPIEIKERMNKLKNKFSSFIVNGNQFNLNILEEIQVDLTQLIGNILYIANHKKSKNLAKYIEYLITFINIINGKLIKRNYNEITDLEVLRDTFAKLILKNQLNLVKNISILISRLPESDDKNKVTSKYRSLRNQITELNMKVTARIIKLNNGKPFSIEELPDGITLQMGGALNNNRYDECNSLANIKHGILKMLMGYFNTDFKEHAKLDMGYLSIYPEITYYNYDDDEKILDVKIEQVDKGAFKHKWYRLNQSYDKAFNPSHVDFELYNKLRTRDFNVTFESFERMHKFNLPKANFNPDDKINIKTIMDVNVIGRTRPEKLGTKLKRTFGLNDSVDKINNIKCNLEKYNTNSTFKLIGDKLVETYFINNSPLFVDRLLEIKNISPTETIYGSNDEFYKNLSLPLGLMVVERNQKLMNSSNKLDLSTLDLPDELKNDTIVSQFIKKILMIPEKDLITMLTNFNQEGMGGGAKDLNDRTDNLVGNNSILRNNTENFKHVYRGIFGYHNNSNPQATDCIDPNDIAAAAAATGSGSGVAGAEDASGGSGVYTNPVFNGNPGDLSNFNNGGGLESVVQSGGQFLPKVTVPIFAYSGYNPDEDTTNYETLSKEYPGVLFIFNDNFKEGYSGKGGNAIIRGKLNAFGIPTGAYPSNKAFVNNDSLYQANTNSIGLNTGVIRGSCQDMNSCPTVQSILLQKLEDIKLKIKPNPHLPPVFKAIVYSSTDNSIDLSTNLFSRNNGTNNTLTDYIRDDIIKKISDFTNNTVPNEFEFGIKKIADATDLNDALIAIPGSKAVPIIHFNHIIFDNLFKEPENDSNTLKLIKYKKKNTVVSTRFYQLKMKQLLVLFCDRIQHYLNKDYPKDNHDIINTYVTSLREEIKTNIISLNEYLFKESGKKINKRGLLSKIISNYDVKKNKNFNKLIKDLVKNINEETQLTNLLYIISQVYKYIHV